MSTAPTGFQTPKTNWQSADIVLPGDFNRIEGNIDAIESGSRTLDPTQAPTGNVGTLRQLLDWFANRIKAITGETNWYDAPVLTLAEAWRIFTNIYVDQSEEPTDNVGNIWQVVGRLANRIKAITGKASWRDAPDLTLAEVWHTFTTLPIDQSLVPTSNVGNIWQAVGWLANRVKAITGKANWYDDPPTTLAALLAMVSPPLFEMPLWSAGVDGDLTVSTDTPFPREVMLYRNLTVQSGKRFYAPSSRLYIICVSDTLQLDGIIEHRMGAAGGTNSVNSGCNGGRGGGTLIVVARRIQGSGTLSVAGNSGNTPTTYSYYSTSGYGGANGNMWGGLSPTGGGQAYYGNPGGGSGGSAASATAWRGLLLIGWLWRFQLHADGEYAAGGGAGANAYYSEYYSSFAAGGGGGGSFVASGGSGGSVAAQTAGGAGGGGGGGGGVLLVMSKEAVPAITITAAGGDGGNGYLSTAAGCYGGAGGGGGGAGGLILLRCPSHSATLIATGGRGGVGVGAGYNGSPGGNGMVLVMLT